MNETLERQIEALLAPVAEREGYEVVLVEVVGALGSPVVRVYLDSDDGVTLDDVVDANAWISRTLDEADPIQRRYTLEVSSPGIDRPLTKVSHFERFVGEAVVVTTRSVEGRSTYRGHIHGVDGDDIAVELGEERIRIPFHSIVKARLKGRVDGCQKGVAE